ncbi:hypothetical protein BFP70_14065 [Thioclava sp. SK-1]|uniref:DUF2478 domain-containing protein n=1 Tax=Thioclava sp. SK-1 TaxID=1889770 RepID=UPI000824B29A|nr:DUF2478 domain-containing protein [Thioclava sp. SK-1]OCX62293.1 hypothetical protein BFP70_14065 [Thioclava sp. SK-1]
MKLAILPSCATGQTDAFLAELARTRAKRGQPIVAMVRAADDVAPDTKLILQLWPSGDIWPIFQQLGPGASGCSLDPGALEQAVECSLRALASAAPGTPVIVNKFGKQEAAGLGTRALIAQALAQGHPVLLAVPAHNRAAFEEFSGGMHEEILYDFQAIEAFFTAKS